jgi:hypothetical protein
MGGFKVETAKADELKLDEHILKITINGVVIYESEKVKRLRELGIKFFQVNDIYYKGDKQNENISSKDK